MSWRKKLKHRLVVALLQLLRAAFMCLPTSLALRLGEFMGRTAGLFTARLRKLAHRQLEAALALEPEQARRSSRQMFGQLGRLLAELLLLPRFRASLPAHVELSASSLEVLRAAIEARGDPQVAAIGHQGDARRREGTIGLAEMWAGKGALRNGLSAREASERLWLLTSAEQYLFAVDNLDWSPEEYERWLGDLLERELLAPDGAV